MKLLLVGDTHGNTRWWREAVVPLAARVGADGIVEVGDFGFWPGKGGDEFLAAVDASGLPVWFADGNHEHHPYLASRVADARDEHGITDATVPVPLTATITYLPRGGRIRFGNVDFVALGGARSIDRRLRTPGVDWFLEESVNDADLDVVAAGGTADVLLAHDTPSGYVIPGLLPDHELPIAWVPERPGCEEHRERIREALEAVRPSLVVHGHYHVRYTTELDEPWGPVRIEGLSHDGTHGAFIVVDTDPELVVVPLAVTFAP